MTFNGESRANIIRIAAILCTVLSTSSFVLRIWGRWLSAAKLGWADLLMAVATVGSFSSSCAWSELSLTLDPRETPKLIKLFSLVAGRSLQSTF